MERVNWNQAVRPSTHDLIAAINSGADDIERIDGVLDDLETAVDGKANASGTYPDLVAGEALSIRSGIRSNTFLSRQLDTDVADGIAEVDRILGNTVVWNQPLQKYSDNSAGWRSLKGGTTGLSYSDGTITYTEDEEQNIFFGIVIQGVWMTDFFLANHKYYVSIFAKGTVNARVNLYGGNATQNVVVLDTALNTNTWTHLEGILSYAMPSNPAGVALRIGHRSSESMPIPGDYLSVRDDVMIFDLTQMYGAGNEPSNVEQFKQQYPEDYYAYTPTPYLLSSNIAGIEGASACEFPAQTLRGALNAHDVMTNTGIERHIASVDLGTLNWSRNSELSTGGAQFAVQMPGRAYTANGICAQYEVKSAAEIANTVYNVIGLHTNGNVIVFNHPTITATADFKTAMDGVILYYEVATPTIETFAAPIDLTYRVAADGSEAWIVPDGTQSAAVTGEIAYPLDPAQALITHESFADFCDKLGAYIGATITETWDGSKYTYSFASGRSALLGSIESEPDALEVTEKDGIVKEIIEDERKEQ